MNEDQLALGVDPSVEKARRLFGLPTLVEQMKRTQMGQAGVTPLDVFNMVARPIESVTAAPTRAAVSAFQTGATLPEAVERFRSQIGEPPETAPSGEQIAQQAGLQGAKAAAAGFGLDLALDPTNLLTGGTAKALPLIGIAGALAKAKGAEKALEAGQVLAKQNPLGFYSKLEDELLKKMGPSATPEQVMAIAKAAKEEEVTSSGLAEFLKGKQKVSQEEVLQQLQASRPQLTEVVKGKTPEQVRLDKLQSDLQGAEADFFLAANKEGIARRDAIDMLVTMNTPSNVDQTEQARQFFNSLPESLKPLATRFNDLYAQREVVNQAARKSATKQNTPKFGKKQEPGGENYREILLQISPGAREFTSSHWQEPNVLAHARVNDRVDETGKKLFHVEEIQSDWHQKGRREGYSLNAPKIELVRPEEINLTSSGVQWVGVAPDGRKTMVGKGVAASEERAKEYLANLFNAQAEDVLAKEASKVPDAPFKKSWMELMTKRLIRQAAESDAERLSWTPGSKQAERYDLSKDVSRIEYEPYGANEKGEALYELTVFDKMNRPVYDADDLNLSDVENVVGKEMAEKIQKKEGRSLAKERPLRPDFMSLEGLDLKIGGEGMKGFYDKMLPDFLRKFGKKYGAELGETTTNGMRVPYLELTPELKKAVLKEGVPLFTAPMAAGLPALVEKMKQQETQ